MWRTHEEIKAYSGNGLGGVLGFVVYFLISPVTWFVIPSEIKAMYEQDGRESPVRGLWGLWFLLPIVGCLRVVLPGAGRAQRLLGVEGRTGGVDSAT